MFKSTYHLLTRTKQREVYTVEEFKELWVEKDEDNGSRSESETRSRPHSKAATLCCLALISSNLPACVRFCSLNTLRPQTHSGYLPED